MRVLICGVIGAAASAAVWLGLEHNMQKDFGWLAVAVGLVTGWSVHKGAGANAGGGYVRGALAVILALAAIVGGRQAYAKYMQRDNANAASVVKAAVAPVAKDDEEVAAGDATDAAPVDEPVMEDPRAGGGLGGQKMPLKQRMSEMDMVWMCVGALAAYVVGKGRDPVPGQVAEPATQSDGDADEQQA